MNEPISPRKNPADRLDEACDTLANFKCAEPKRHIFYHITYLVEALREKAARSETFSRDLDELAGQLEARVETLKGVIR